MDNVLMTFCNYGSLGLVCAYFIYKDYSVSRQLLDVLSYIKGFIERSELNE